MNSSIKLSKSIINNLEIKEIIYAEITSPGAMGNAGGIILYILDKENKKLICYYTNVFDDEETYSLAEQTLTRHLDHTNIKNDVIEQVLAIYFDKKHIENDKQNLYFDFYSGGMGNSVLINKKATLEITDNNFFIYTENNIQYPIFSSVEGVFISVTNTNNFSRTKTNLEITDSHPFPPIQQPNMKGVLLVNLGSPESPTAKDVKPYLDEFLMDKYVIDLPYLLRAFVVRGIIIGFRNRAEKSAEAYSQIWWDEGSPLIVLSERLHEKVQEKSDIPVSLAMRYGKPSIKSGLEELHKKGVTEVLVLPLYPQHAMASTLTITELANKIQKEQFPNMKLTHFPAFYNRKEYIVAQAESIKKHLGDFDYEKLVFSYHGIPERHIRKSTKKGSHKKFEKDVYCCEPNTSDSEFCYRTHCFETTRQIIEYLNLDKNKVMNTFQSRLSGDKWLDPYTDVEIDNLAKNGTKKIAVVTPAFVSDCLETLEEIGMRAKEDFIKNGGEEFLTIPCMNEDELWVNAIHTWIEEWKTLD